MTRPCPRCTTALKVLRARRPHGLAVCPACGERLVFTAVRVPFRADEDAFELRTWREYLREIDRSGRVGVLEFATARPCAAALCAGLFGLASGLAASQLEPGVAFWPVFGAAFAIGLAAFTITFGLLHAGAVRRLAAMRRDLAARMEGRPPSVTLGSE